MSNVNTQDAQAPAIPITWWGVLIRAVLGTVVVLVAPIIVGLLLNAFDYPSDPFVTGLLSLGLSVLSGALVFVFVWAWMKFVEKRPFSDTGFGARRVFLGLLVATLATAVIIYVSLAITLAFGLATGEPAPEFPQDLPGSLGAVLQIIGAAFFLQGIPEELVFRGWLFSVTKHRPWLTFWWTSLLFTGLHLLSNFGAENALDYLIYLISPFGIAVLAAACVLRWGNGWLAAGVHVGAHIGTFLADFTMPVLEPRANWVVQGLVMTAAAVVIIFTDPKRRRGTK